MSWTVEQEPLGWTFELTKKEVMFRHGSYSDRIPHTIAKEHLALVGKVIAEGFDTTTPETWWAEARASVLMHWVSSVEMIAVPLAANVNSNANSAFELLNRLAKSSRTVYRAVFHNPSFFLWLIERPAMFEDLQIWQIGNIARKCFKPGDHTPWFTIPPEALRAMAQVVMRGAAWSLDHAAAVGHCYGLFCGLSIPAPSPRNRLDHLRYGLYLCDMCAQGVRPSHLFSSDQVNGRLPNLSF